MSPLLFLAIPVVIFVVGSTILWLGSRFYGNVGSHKAPAELRSIVPMVQQQRETGWPVGSGTYTRH